MIIGIPRELKEYEFRVAVTTGAVESLVHDGHTVLIETGAGVGSGFSDDEYERAGAQLRATAAEVYGESEMVVKVKEPLPAEYELLRPGLVMFTYLHLAADKLLTETLLNAQVAAVGYETVQRDDRSLPLLTPMSEIAGRMAVQIGAHYLEVTQGGRGILLSGVPGVRAGAVAILGGGVVGTNAARVALGLGARTTVIDLNVDRLAYLDNMFGGQLTTVASNSRNIYEAVRRAEVVIGAVLLPGGKTPTLVTEEMIAAMAPGSVVLDVAVDQGGCIETIHPTTHAAPTYRVHDVIHYAVSNIPSAVPRTATYALSNATLPYIRALAARGLVGAVKADATLARGVNTYRGHITHAAVAGAFDQTHVPLEQLL